MFRRRVAILRKTFRAKETQAQNANLDMWKYVEIKCQLDATEVFIADLIACSTCFGYHYAHHQELKSIMQWLLPVVFRAVVLCAPDDGHSGTRNMLSKQ